MDGRKEPQLKQKKTMPNLTREEETMMQDDVLNSIIGMNSLRPKPQLKQKKTMPNLTREEESMMKNDVLNSIIGMNSLRPKFEQRDHRQALRNHNNFSDDSMLDVDELQLNQSEYNIAVKRNT